MAKTGDQIGLNQSDVATILDQLRTQVRERRIAQGQLELGPLERDLQRSLDEIELYRVVSAHWPLLGKSLPQRAIALVNKLVRRYLRWYINPIVEQQNAYNDAVARTLRLLADAYIDLGDQLAKSAAPSAAAKHQPPDGASAIPPAADDQPPQGNAGLPAQSYAELMALVQRRADAEPPASFPDLALSAVEPQLRQRAQVSAHWPLTGRSPRERAIALANKLVRRYLRWYINPIVEQQNAANLAINAALLAIIRLDAERRAQAAAARVRAKL